MPDWRDLLDLNLTNVWWTAAFLIGAICTSIHFVWAYRRWRATVARGEWRSVKAAAFWFTRQDALNVVVGVAMAAAGICVILRFNGPYVTHLLELGATAFMINKIWNLYDDARVQDFLRSAQARQRRTPDSDTANTLP